MFWPDWERTAALSKLEVQRMIMSGQDQIGRSVLVFLKFAGDLQSTEKPMHHQALVILTGTRRPT